MTTWFHQQTRRCRHSEWCLVRCVHSGECLHQHQHGVVEETPCHLQTQSQTQYVQQVHQFVAQQIAAEGTTGERDWRRCQQVQHWGHTLCHYGVLEKQMRLTFVTVAWLTPKKPILTHCLITAICQINNFHDLLLCKNLLGLHWGHAQSVVFW